MNKHTPQEWADWTGCYVNQDKNGLWYLHKNKPELMLEEGYWNPQKGASDFEMNIFSILISASADHNWTHLYEPDSYYQDPPKADNKPDHLGEVYVHQEYEVVSTVSKPSLISTVNSLMKDGWKPQGGVSYLSGLFYQAMVRGV